MRFVVVGDVHGQFGLFSKVLQNLKQKYNISVAFQVGDLAFISSDDRQYLKMLATPGPKEPPLIFDGFDNIEEALCFLRGEIELPVPVLFVGGNHEDWPYLDKFEKEAKEKGIKPPYLVAPHLYFLGRAGVVKVMGMRLAFLSGIYDRIRFEPCSEHPLERWAITKNDEERLLASDGPADIFLSHEWPAQLVIKTRKGNESVSIGCEVIDRALKHFKPQFSFHGHIHCYVRNRCYESECIGLNMLSTAYNENIALAICEYDGNAVKIISVEAVD